MTKCRLWEREAPDRLLLIDGGPAFTPERSYPIVPYKVTIVAGQVNTLR